MNKKEFTKINDSIRKEVSRQYGWKQNSYLNWKVEKGYFFCQIHLPPQAILEVKPLYVDDLWWEISEAFKDAKKPPMSLRGNGAIAIGSQVINEYRTCSDCSSSPDEIKASWKSFFDQATQDIQVFLKENPDADSFIPQEDKVRSLDGDRLLYIMTLLHHKQIEEVVEIINEARQKRHMCSYRGPLGDSYDYILRWCNFLSQP